MSKKIFKISLAAIVIVLFVGAAGCNYPGGGSTAAPLSAQYTEAAKTVVAELTAVGGQAGQAEKTVQPSGGTQTTKATNSPTVLLTKTPTLTPSPTTTLMISPTPTENLQLLYTVDFTKKTGWYTVESPNFSIGYTDQGYQFLINNINTNIWSTQGQVYRDIVLETNGERVAGPEDGYYGLMCRQVDDHNYYALVIGSNGFFGIGKMQNGDFQFLKEGKDTNGIIKPGAQVFNKIRADCVGDKLRLMVNGQKLMEVQDGDYPEGATGLIAGTRKNPGLEALFNNYSAYQPLG